MRGHRKERRLTERIGWLRAAVSRAVRVLFWGALVMALIAGVGALFGTVA